MLCPQYFHNTFTTNPMWQVVTSRWESNFSGGFKLKTCNNVPTKICYDKIVKMLWMYLGVYTVQCGRFWRGFLHRAYKVRFHPMLGCTYFWKIKTGLHKVRLILATGCCSFGYMGWTFKNYYSKFWAFGPLKNSILSPFWLLLNWAFLYQVSTTTK